MSSVLCSASAFVVPMMMLACRPSEVPGPGAVGAASAAEAVEADAVRLVGHRGVEFGMAVAQAQAVLGEAITADAEACSMVATNAAGTPPAYAWMIHEGVIVRLDAQTDGVVAEGGGKIGMRVEELRERYPGAIDDGPQKYDPAGRVWIVGPKDAAHFVFEVDGAGNVVGWRAGRVPEVDWVERCG